MPAQGPARSGARRRAPGHLPRARLAPRRDPVPEPFEQGDQPVDVRFVAGEAHGNPHRADGLVVETDGELLEGEVIAGQFLETSPGLVLRELEGRLRRARIAEVAGTDRDP